MATANNAPQATRGPKPARLSFNSQYGEFVMQRAQAQAYAEACLEVANARKYGNLTPEAAPMPSPESFGGTRPEYVDALQLDNKDIKGIMFLYGAICQGVERDIPEEKR